jgi:hypothetical protein
LTLSIAFIHLVASSAFLARRRVVIVIVGVVVLIVSFDAWSDDGNDVPPGAYDTTSPRMTNSVVSSSFILLGDTIFASTTHGGGAEILRECVPP